MRSWKLTRLAGVDVFVHWSFLLLLGWIVFSVVTSGGSIATALRRLFLTVAVFACVLLHELGHALAARQFGIQTRDITLLPIGGVARLDEMPRRPAQELWIAIAGPLVNVVIAAVLFLLSSFVSLSMLVSPVLIGVHEFIHQIWLVNVGLVLFNLLPAFPMDGGRILRSFLAMFLPYHYATQTAANVGKVMAVLFGIVGVIYIQPVLLLIAAFVYFAGRAEAQAVNHAFRPWHPTVPFRTPSGFDVQPVSRMTGVLNIEPSDMTIVQQNSRGEWVVIRRSPKRRGFIWR